MADQPSPPVCRECLHVKTEHNWGICEACEVEHDKNPGYPRCKGYRAEA
jgi:hypothetical protein